VLAAGSVAESVPECITSIYDEDGVTVIDHIEPLCAFLADESRQKVLRNLNSEFLRLAAAIISCPYDSLRQRQKRYRVRQAMLAFGTIAAVALAIIVLLIRWNLEVTAKNQEIIAKNEEITEKNQEILGLNAQIQEQLIQTLVNESKALTLLGQSRLEAGDRIGAIKSALSALEGDRPYYAPAEEVLSEALFVYQWPEFRNVLAIDQFGNTPCIGYSPCGRYAILDNVEHMTLLDLATGEKVWATSSPSSYLKKTIYIDPDLQQFILLDPDGGYICSFKTGETLYSLYDHYNNMIPFAAFESTGLAAFLLWKENIVVVFDSKTTTEVLRFDFTQNKYDFLGDFSTDGRHLFVMSTLEENNNLSVIDCRTGDLWEETIPGSISDYVLLPDGDLALMATHADGDNVTTHFFRVDFEQKTTSILTERITADIAPEQFLMDEQYLYCIFENNAIVFSLSDGFHLAQVKLTGLPVDSDENNAYLDQFGRLVIVRQDGVYAVEMNSRKRWGCNQIYESNAKISLSHSDGDWLALMFSDLPTVRFLRLCGDANVTPAEEPAPISSLFASFENGMLKVSRYSYFEPLTVSCPYDLNNGSYFQRSFLERYNMTDCFEMPELYAGENQVVVLSYYESGSVDGEMAFNTPDAYAIYSAEYDRWNRFEHEVLDGNSIGIFFMNEAAGFAITGDISRLSIYDFASNSITLDLQVPLTFLSGVRFSTDDRYALAFDSTDFRSVLIDLTSGDILGEFDFTIPVLDEAFNFVVTDDRLYIKEVSPDDIHNYGVIIDRASAELVAKIPDMEYYDSKNNRIVCSNPFRSYPVYSTEELIAMGKETLAISP